MKTLTVFTPTYNRAHTLARTYDSLCRQTCKDFEWLVVDDGSTDNTRELIQRFIDEAIIPIRYIYKENGGLYTGYNIAYANIETELSVCIDSDDYMPDDAVTLIVKTWHERGTEQYAGIIGLDFYAGTDKPINGYFPDDMTECWFLDLFIKHKRRGDSKHVMRTDLMKQVAPQIGFEGEKNFNPVYMLYQVCDERPLLVLNENLCYVDYQQNDSMSASIFCQYMDSPRSFAKLRLLEMNLKRNTLANRFRSAVHYVSSCLIAKEERWLKKTSYKILVFCAIPFGFLWYWVVLYKNKKNCCAYSLAERFSDNINCN